MERFKYPLLFLLLMDIDKIGIVGENSNRLSEGLSKLPHCFRDGPNLIDDICLEARLDEINGIEIFPRKKIKCDSLCLPDSAPVYRVSVWKGDSASFHYQDEKYTLYMNHQD